MNIKKPSIKRKIVTLAIPNIISNITVPLLSLVDAGLAGNMDVYGSLASVSIASVSISTIYWLFGFLRLGTTGLVAQAFGAKDTKGINRYLGRGVLLALIFGIILSLLSPLIMQFVCFMAQGDLQIASQSEGYIQIALLGAPAAMLLYVLNGWFIGMQNTRIPMEAAILINCINIFLSFFCIHILDMGVEGLAQGTILAQYIGVAYLFLRARFRFRSYLSSFEIKDIWGLDGMGYYLRLNRDLFLRSALLSSVTIFFTYASTKEGEVVVSANTLLMQLFSLFSYFMDGFAYAGEALTGRFVGEKRIDLVEKLIKTLFIIAIPISLVIGGIYYFFPSPLLNLLSNRADIVNQALKYVIWAALIPPLGFASFLWDGVYVGATFSKGLFISMLFACSIFFIIYFSLVDSLGAITIWLAFDSYLLTRGLTQSFMYKILLKKIKSSFL